MPSHTRLYHPIERTLSRAEYLGRLACGVSRLRGYPALVQVSCSPRGKSETCSQGTGMVPPEDAYPCSKADIVCLLIVTSGVGAVQPCATACELNKARRSGKYRLLGTTYSQVSGSREVIALAHTEYSGINSSGCVVSILVINRPTHATPAVLANPIIIHPPSEIPLPCSSTIWSHLSRRTNHPANKPK